MSPMAGRTIIERSDSESPHFRDNFAQEEDHEQINVLEHLRSRWTRGTTEWEAKTAEWLFLIIAIEMFAVPRFNKISNMHETYTFLMRELVSLSPELTWSYYDHKQKQRRSLPFQKNQSVNLVRDFVTCMNELSQINEMCEIAIEELMALQKQWTNTVSHLDSNSPVNSCVILATTKESIERDHRRYGRILNELKSSLDVVSLYFWLRKRVTNEA